MTTNESLIEEASAELEATQSSMTDLLDQIDFLEKNIAKRNDRLEKQARTVQTSGQTNNYIDFLLSADSLSDALGRIDVVVNMVRSNSSLIEEQVKDKEALESTVEETGATIRRQNELVTSLETTSQDLEVQTIEQEVLLAQLGAERANLESEREAFLAERDEAQARVEELTAAREETETLQTEQETIAVEEVSNEELIAEVRSESTTEVTEEVEEPVETTQVAVASVSANESSNTITSANTASRQEPAQTNTTAAQPASNNRSNNSNASSQVTRSAQNTSSSNSNNSSQTQSNQSQSSQPQESTPAPAPAPKPEPAPKPAVPSSGSAAWGSIQATANSLLGIRYSWGGTTTAGFDCSGFTQFGFRQNGVSIPRTSGAQYAASTRVSNPVAGDLVFFGTGGRVTHVGIYAGGGRYVGSQTSTGVAYTNVHTGYWGSRFMGYGRVN